MVEVRTEQLQRATSKVKNDGKDLHISGEPGIGKTEFLNHLKSRLEDEFKIEEKTVRSYYDQADLERDLLHITRRAALERDSKPNQITGASGGLGPISGGATTDDRVRDLYKLEDLTRDWSGNPLVLCIDDIHKIDEDEQTVRETIDEIASTLGKNVHLITAGQISISGIGNVEEIHLNLFTPAETSTFLRKEFGEVSDETVQDVHAAVEGHPLYIGLLSESSEDETDLVLPEDEVHDTIESRYLESLPTETEEFLRQVAVLPELDQTTVSGIIDDQSPTVIDRQLRDLNRSAIVQEVNRTEDGGKIYKIHERFRVFLLQKQTKTPNIHRKALKHHLQQLLDLLLEENEDTWIDSLPHSFHVRYHLDNLYDEASPAALQQEVTDFEVTYPERGILMVYAGISIFPSRSIELFRNEHEKFSDWVYSEAENEPLADLLVQIIEWGLSQLADDEPIELSDVQVDGSIEDVPIESAAFDDMDLSDAHTQQLKQSWQNILSYFLIEEPHRSNKHKHQAWNQIQFYGISYEVIVEFRDRVKSVLLDSELGDEFESIIDQYFDTLGSELGDSLTSSLDFRAIRDQSMELGKNLFDNIHEDLLLGSGKLGEVAIEGGGVLEKAENPAFALAWYSLFISHFRDYPVDSDSLERIRERYFAMADARRLYEEELEEPIFSAEDTAEDLELESSNTE